MSSAPKYLYVVTAVDDQSPGPADPPAEPRNGSKKRIGLYPEHKAYQGATADPSDPRYIKKITAGPLVTEDGKYMVGSSFIIEASSKAEVETFYKNDPFFINGVWSSVVCERHIALSGIQAVSPPASL